jgi:hypothetical protein
MFFAGMYGPQKTGAKVNQQPPSALIKGDRNGNKQFSGKASA